MEEIISNVLETLQYKFKEITIKRTSSVLPKVSGDKFKLEQVLINIINNSLDAMNQKGELTFQTGVKNEKVWTEVTDTGIGIKKDQISNIFDPFYTTKEIGKGTGLGLSICFGIMELHQGTIELFGTPGVGTTARIQLPVS
jgi:two-component system, NtrC family, sensor kinase